MPTPEFVLGLRRAVGHAPLWLSCVTAVVLRGDEVLLERRADTGAVTPVVGIIEPGEEPAVAAAREVLEECGVVAVAERLAWVHTGPQMTYPNGDRCQFLDLVFRCRWVSGHPNPMDGEASAAFWHPVAELSRVPWSTGSDHAERIRVALSSEQSARFAS